MNQPFDWWLLLAGLGLFLFAMNQLEKSLKALAGKRFRKTLQNSTKKPIHSVLSGITATTILQSSSLVGLIVLAFVGAGIIPLVNAIGIIIGSNLGTTFTGWIVTTLGFKLNFSSFVYPLLGTSGIVYGLTKGRSKLIAQFVLGFALLLMGLDFMKTAASELENFVNFGGLSGYPLITYLIAGALFTAIIQSSSATMMLTLAALNANIISLEIAAAIVIGADLGTTSTVFLGSLQGAIAKRRIAMAHVIFNFSVDLIAFVFLYPLIALIQQMELTDPLYSLVAFHSLFNFIGLVVFLPIISQFAKLLEKWFPEQKEPVNLYLKGVPQVDSSIAIEALEMESKQLFTMVNDLILRFLKDKSKNSSNNLAAKSSGDELEAYMRIKTLEGEIIDYALQIKINEGSSINGQSQKQAEQIDRLINLVRNSVYAAKAYKDIYQDLESFETMDNQYFSNYFQQIKQNAIDSNYQLNQWVNSEQGNLARCNSSNSLCEKLDAQHAKILQEVYSKKAEIKLSTIELSTLLNVLREISSSFHSLIAAAKLI